MTRSPLVSVVIPFYNAGFLAESIESVCAQHHTHWELLLCDDGSVDDSPAVARGYAARDPARVRLLEHPGRQNLGASAARNLGLAHARGDLIAFLDADDVWLPNKLGEQVTILAARPDADALTGSTRFWYGWTGDPGDAARDYVERVGVPHESLLPAPMFLERRLRGRVASPPPCSLIVRRHAVERSGGFEAAIRTVFEDQAFYVKLFLDSSLLVVDTCWDLYRQHPDSACASTDRAGARHDAQVEYLAWVREYLTARGVTDRRVWSALRLAEWRVRHPRAAALTRRVRHAYYGMMRAGKRAVQAVVPGSAA